MVAGSVSIGIVAVSAVLATLTWQTILAQATDEGEVIARLLAHSAAVSEEVVTEAGRLLDRELISQGLLIGHLADVAHIEGVSERDLNRRLMEITARTDMGEILVADASGRLYAGSADDYDNLEDATTAAGLPASALNRLLSGDTFTEALGIGRRPLGGIPMHYIGVRGPGQARAVVVGRDQRDIIKLDQALGVQRLIDTLLRAAAVDGVWIVQPHGDVVAGRVADSLQNQQNDFSLREKDLVSQILSGHPAKAIMADGRISVATPLVDSTGLLSGTLLVRLSAAPLDRLLFDYLFIGGSMAIAALLLGITLSVFAGRRVASPMMRIADAAAAVDARTFAPGSLRDITVRRDELGDLARTFETMAQQVFAREEELERQVNDRTRELTIRNEQLDQAKQRLEADLELAKLMQSAILPAPFPAERGWTGTARMVPALQMAGDFYDYIRLDQGRLGLVVADVSGKGVAPAFFMAVSRAVLQDAARRSGDPGSCLSEANQALCEQNPLEMFVTVFYAVLDPRNGVVDYANGGHNPPYLIPHDGTARQLPGTEGTLLGIIPDMPYDSATITLQLGDTLFLYTDGVTEAMTVAGDMFGEKRLEDVLNQSKDLPVEALLTTVTDAIRDFVGAAPQSDDITCLVVRYLGDSVEYAGSNKSGVAVDTLVGA